MKESVVILELPEDYGSVIGDHEFANCTDIQKIVLPAGIEKIDHYAFYFCRSLEEIQLHAGIRIFGRAVFMGCKKVKKIVVWDVENDIHFLTEMLYDFQYEVEIELHYRDGSFAKLTFPEYYEESVENTPARIIDIVFHGSGYKYRQCFRNRMLDYDKYDSLFSYAKAQEFTETCLRIALNRLTAPLHLSAAAKEKYIGYLREENRELAKKLCGEDDLSAVRKLADAGYFTEEVLEEFQNRAASLARAELGSFFMNYRMEHFKPKKKSFDFEDWD
ncbi:MAG: leucine-rich repeat protein [Lachnospiraceae bacterium]